MSSTCQLQVFDYIDDHDGRKRDAIRQHHLRAIVERGETHDLAGRASVGEQISQADALGNTCRSGTSEGSAEHQQMDVSDGGSTRGNCDSKPEGLVLHLSETGSKPEGEENPRVARSWKRLICDGAGLH